MFCSGDLWSPVPAVGDRRYRYPAAGNGIFHSGVVNPGKVRMSTLFMRVKAVVNRP